MSQTSREIIWKVVDGEAMILDVTTGDYFSLNRVGTEIWRWLQDGEDMATITERLSTRYSISAATAERDVRQLCEELRAMGLCV